MRVLDKGARPLSPAVPPDDAADYNLFETEWKRRCEKRGARHREGALFRFGGKCRQDKHTGKLKRALPMPCVPSVGHALACQVRAPVQLWKKEMPAMPAAPAAIQSGAFCEVIPPSANTGMDTALLASRSASGPSGGP